MICMALWAWGITGKIFVDDELAAHVLKVCALALPWFSLACAVWTEGDGQCESKVTLQRLRKVKSWRVCYHYHGCRHRSLRTQGRAAAGSKAKVESHPSSSIIYWVSQHGTLISIKKQDSFPVVISATCSSPCSKDYELHPV
jgi:hypothetical protein